MKNLLYLDDSKTSIFLVERFLHDLVNVIGVNTIPDAILTLEEKDISLVLLDYQLGNKTSFEFADYMRQQSEKHKKTPIVLITAFRSDGIFYRGSKKGINDFIAKPVEKGVLRDLIQIYLNDPTARRDFKPRYLTAQCVAWRKDNIYYQFSPDLRETIEGDNPEEVKKKMQAALSKKSNSILAEVEIVLHNVEYDASQGS